MNRNMNYIPPVAVGGIGGSGTRMVAEILKKIGFYIGTDLNDANDNLWFTLLFKRTDLLSSESSQSELAELVDLFFNAMVYHQPFTKAQQETIEKLAAKDRLQHRASWLKQRAESMQKTIKEPVDANSRWGWKEPNTHIFLDMLEQEISGLRYIHVIRHGLDMAHSANQNQLKLWGPLFLGTEYTAVTPYNSLKFWCYAHKRIISLGEKMGNRFLLLNYDQLYSNPEEHLPVLLNFLGIEPPKHALEDILKLIDVPKSMERYKQYGLGIYDPSDVEYVKKLGFKVEDREVGDKLQGS